MGIKETNLTTANYFTSDSKDVELFRSGSIMLDLALGGGWAAGRILNVVGQRSSGKTLLAIEAIANYAEQYPKASIYYCETESAFDPSYAAALGLPLDRVSFAADNTFDIVDAHLTVEGLFEYLEKIIVLHEGGKKPAFVIVDSLDALSDRTELSADIDKASYGANKAKMLSQMFRRIVSDLHKSNITLMFISQVRDNISGYGEKYSKAGGKALDFYCSQIIYITEAGKLKKTSKGVERPVGVKVKAVVKKNKVALPFREASYSILFGWGIDDITSCLSWMQEVKMEIPSGELGCGESKIALSNFCRKMADADAEEYDRVMSILEKAVKQRWKEIEDGFLPKRMKYSRSAGEPS